MAKRKHSADWMLARVREYLSGKGSYRQIARANGISAWSLRGWVRKYEKQGEASFMDRAGNASYSKEFKASCVLAVLYGEGSVDDIVAKYNISSRSLDDYYKRCGKDWGNVGIALEVARTSGKKMHDVCDYYNRYQRYGWNRILVEIGINPGSVYYTPFYDRVHHHSDCWHEYYNSYCERHDKFHHKKHKYKKPKKHHKRHCRHYDDDDDDDDDDD